MAERSDPTGLDLSVAEIFDEAQHIGGVGVWAWQIDSGQMWWSDETYRLFGLQPTSTLPHQEQLLDMVHPDDRAALENALSEALAGATYDIRHRVLSASGEVVHVRGRGRVMRTEDGTPVRMLGTVMDITEEAQLLAQRDEALEALAQSEELHRLLVENAYDVIWTMAVDGTITYVSPAVERVRGITPAEAAAQSLDEIHPPESAAKVTEYFGRLYAAMEAGDVPPIYHGEHEYYRNDGSIMVGALQVIPQVDRDGAVMQILGVTRDISESRRLEDELTRVAQTDYLTGLWNRRQAERLLTEAVDRQGSTTPVTLLIIDVDRFKYVNDEKGHGQGDRVLIELAARLEAQLRAGDVIARWGGDELVILLADRGLPEGVVVAERLCESIAATPFGDVGTVTVSVGAAELMEGDDLDSWLHRADVALYAAKDAGRNTVRRAGPDPAAP